MKIGKIAKVARYFFFGSVIAAWCVGIVGVVMTAPWWVTAWLVLFLASGVIAAINA